MSSLSYAQEREANIARNHLILASLGVEKLRPKTEPKETRRKNQKKQKSTTAGIKRKADDNSDTEADDKPLAKRSARVANDENALPQPGESAESRRRSSRIARKPADAVTRVEMSRGTPRPISVKVIVDDDSRPVKRERRHNPKTYGSIPGIEVGSWWASREECSNDAIHAPWVGGIAPGPDGAYSVALSGGYDDDVDDGYAFTYTGAGGRDLRGTKAAPKNLRTAEQSFDQSFEHNHNKALKRSVETGKPIRVIRGFKLRSKYGPSEGYRYDGLYAVRKCWQEKGLNQGGFLVCKYAFVRLPGQPPIPVKTIDGEDADEVASEEDGSDAQGHASQD